jgi:radical SAM superfamily enzyme YgiQ (UPF0313 family)
MVSVFVLYMKKQVIVIAESRNIRLKLELIVPATHKNRRKSGKVLLPPLGMAVIAALTPPDVEVSITDENVTRIDYQKDVDLVGITSLTSTSQRAYEIADTFRARGKKVVLGGIHPSVLPEEAIQHADAVVIGEAEGIWPTVIADFKENRLQKIYRQDVRPSLSGLPHPRRDLFAKKSYYFANTIYTTRGCPYACSFCTVTSFFGRTFRCRPVADVIAEIKTLNRKKHFIFLDDNIVGNPTYSKDLFRALIPLKIKWVGQCSVIITKDDELLKLAAASGCVDLFIGFESLSESSLKAINKKTNSVAEYETIIQKLHDAGIGVHGFFIFGLDGDDADSFQRTVRFAQKARLESAQFDILTPYPGTAIFTSLDKESRIINKDWSQYGHDLMFVPKSLSREILQEGRTWAWREFYNLPSIWKRLGAGHHDAFFFWVANLYYYYQVHRLKRLH